MAAKGRTCSSGVKKTAKVISATVLYAVMLYRCEATVVPVHFVATVCSNTDIVHIFGTLL